MMSASQDRPQRVETERKTALQDNGLLIIALVAVGLYFFLRRRRSPAPDPETAPREDHTEFWGVLEAAVAEYKARMVPYTVSALITKGQYPARVLPLLESRHGRSGGRPWLSLPAEWKGRSVFGIRAWMEKKKMPYNDSLPALHQLEKILEEEALEEAKAILEAALVETDTE